MNLFLVDNRLQRNVVVDMESLSIRARGDISRQFAGRHVDDITTTTRAGFRHSFGPSLYR